MQRIAKFEKVSLKQFQEGYTDAFGETDNDLTKIYESLILPKRATSGSAGYDFYLPIDISLASGESIKIATGIRVWIEDGWVLKVYPKSGLGNKYSVRLNNTVGIIDSDYYGSDNEGHIFCKITNGFANGKVLNLSAGSAFVQGLFIEYGITLDDEAKGIRNGGFGSTAVTRDS